MRMDEDMLIEKDEAIWVIYSSLVMVWTRIDIIRI